MGFSGSPDGLDRIAVGRIGEDIAAEYLIANGYEIIGRNVTIAGGEIDILATDGRVTAVVEVKTRTMEDVFRPRDALTWTKAKQLKKLAQALLSRNKELLKRPVRFDLIEVVFDQKKMEAERVDHHKRYFD